MTTTKNIANANANANANALPMYSFNFKSKELARLTVTIAQAEAQGARMKLVACNALANVDALGADVLNESGFKTIAEYGRVQFGYSKSNVYDMIKVAEKFGITEDGSITSYPQLTGLGWTALLALSKTDDATITKLIGDGELTPSTSVRAVKALVAPKKPEKVTKDTKATKTTKAPEKATKTPEKATIDPKKVTKDTEATEIGIAPFTAAFDRHTLVITVTLTDGSKKVYTYNMDNSTEACAGIQAFQVLVGVPMMK